MSWDWSSPIALGLFVLMCGGAVLLLGIAAAVASSSARWALPPGNRRR
ncbi:MAG TPA: hypothetical protein VFW90_00265 [Candidatus Saccharimonadales bacterium]|nr:hypothetical protein [Candidatus Saccharimonadales bacterium]